MSELHSTLEDLVRRVERLESRKPDRWLKQVDAAEYAAMSEEKLRQYEQAGLITFEKSGRTKRCKQSQLDALIASETA